VRPVIPFSLFFNRLLLAMSVLRLKPVFEVVHARTDYSAAVAGILKVLRRAALVWDCRGDAVAEAAERLERVRWLPSSMKRLKRWRAERERRKAANWCDRAVFVSEPLARLCAPLLSGKLSVVIPCAASEDLFFYDAELRAQVRKRLGYKNGERVFVFSGSLVGYQCFEEMVVLFEALQRTDLHARLLVLTPDVETARRRLMHFNSNVVQVIRVPLDEVNGYLNAADIAFMLRHSSELNRVASPTKFAEYCLTGLPVIMTDAVEDAWRISERLGNQVRIEKGMVSLPGSFNRAEVARRACAELGKRYLAHLYDLVYAPPNAKEARFEQGI
jgi:glycosyltransferase involved in cell wall biosynthesis